VQCVGAKDLRAEGTEAAGNGCISQQILQTVALGLKVSPQPLETSVGARVDRPDPHTQHLGDLRAAQLLKVAQREHLTFGAGQRRQSLLQDPAKIVPLSPVTGAVYRDMTLRQFLFEGRRRHIRVPTPTPLPIQRRVSSNAEEPGSKPLGVPQAPTMANHGKHRVLEQILCGFAVADAGVQVVENAGTKLVHDLGVHRRVAPAQSLTQSLEVSRIGHLRL
jgi:hypothetical protein